MSESENKLTQKNFVEEFIEFTIFNMPEVIEYYEDIKETREYNSLPELRKVIDTYFNNFCFNNGLLYKLDDNITIKDDEKSTLLYLLTQGNKGRLPKNRYRRNIIKYYFDNINSKMKDIRFEDIKSFKADDYYAKRPPIYCKVPNLKDEDISKPKLEFTFTDEKLIQNTMNFINIGQSIQFDIKGFPMNQILYLLVGMAVKSTLGRLSTNKFNTFKEMIDYIKSFIQINLSSICINTIDTTKDESENNFYNLVTYLMFDVDERKYNGRYEPAHKYFKDYKLEEHVQKNKTLYKIKEEEDPSGMPGVPPIKRKKAFILTEYPTKEDVMNVWKELEEIFINSNKQITDELIIKWFDGQLLTRSTCLIGVILIILKEQKIIKFKKDEMPDWKSIALNTFEGTYDVVNDLPKIKISDDEFSEITLRNVLNVIFNYINNIYRMKG